MDNINQLIISIQQLHFQLQISAVNAVNQMLTIRNWLIGFYIVEYEQNGKDRADYGVGLLKTLSLNLKDIKGMEERSLRRYRQFYLFYPQLSDIIRGSLSPISEIIGILKAEEIKERRESTNDKSELIVPGEKILSKLSYSHIELLLSVSESIKRTFYEIECIKASWSVRELKRQILSKLFERSGLSEAPKKLIDVVRRNIKPQRPSDIIKNIYAFEFLDLPIKEIVEESDIEKALLDSLQQFILEMGYGFCFEARQKRILIGEKYYFIDLVFYHRVLKCHVLIEFKIGEFEHGDIAQLNTYLNYFKTEIREIEDNTPVGILLVAEKDQALVKYATAGMDENLFVNEYMLKLPDAKILKQYIENEIKRM
ncbi:MAG TPA: PDDEXK nuclease domain-containing protein [Prolixibacteraceae bacterium]|nr:PDDEXK nuclease domain-containing protein [Prolixibacteraceae bacterium]